MQAQATLSVSQLFVEHAANVTVASSGHWFHPSFLDVLALFSPPEAAENASVELAIMAVPTYATPGGSLVLQLVNARLPYRLAFFQPLNGTMTITALSPVVNVDAYQPMQIHLAFTANVTEMRVMWVSGVNISGAVQYGSSSSTYNFTVLSSVPYTYTAGQFCADSPAVLHYRHPGFFYNVLLTNLQPDTKYYYR